MKGEKFQSLQTAVNDFIKQRQMAGDPNEQITIGMFDDQFHLIARRENIYKFNK